jgi:hypothetical protein
LRIFKNCWFDKFARKQDIADAVLAEAIDRAERGLIDADLGGGVVKQRVARQGEGRSGGYRTIILFRSGDRAVFVFGFAKSDRANITADELASFRRAAGYFLAFSNQEIDGEVASGNLMEVHRDENL